MNYSNTDLRLHLSDEQWNHFINRSQARLTAARAHLSGEQSPLSWKNVKTKHRKKQN